MHYQVRPRSGPRPLISVILVDWSARESFHSLAYLNRQTLPRDQFELIWVEFYDRRPGELRNAIADAASPAPLDAWIVLERSPDTYYHKHEMYNAGLIAATGEICIICDSDTMFAETFLQSVYLAFRSAPGVVVHVDQVRSEHRGFYPFNHPSVSEFMATPGLTNWVGATTEGLADRSDPLHTRNYGACMCARRRDLIEIGGADEHLDYLGYICGPHEMTFRLVNAGRREKWIEHEWLYHAWHPGQSGQSNFGGPHDGRNFSLRTLDLIQSRRVMPWVINPTIAALRESPTRNRAELLSELAARDRRDWTNPERHLEALTPVVLVEENVAGHNILSYRDLFIGFAQWEGAFDPQRLGGRDYGAAYVASTLEEVKQGIREGPRSRYHISRTPLLGLPLNDPAVVHDPPAVVPAPPPATSAAENERARAHVRSRLATGYGRALYHAGRTHRALGAFQLAVTCDPANRVARKGLGDARVAEGRAAQARDDFDQLLTAIPAGHQMERCEALIGRAWAHYQLGDWRAAVSDFSTALSLAGSVGPEALRINIYQGRAWASARARQRSQALADFRQWRVARGRARAGIFWLQYGLFSLRGRLARVKRGVRGRRETLR